MNEIEQERIELDKMAGDEDEFKVNTAVDPNDEQEREMELAE